MAEETQTTQTTTELGGAQTAGGDPNTTSTPDSVQAEKTFTQAEVNELIRVRLERERKGQPTKDELTAFRDWQNSQKTAEQKAAWNGKANKPTVTTVTLTAAGWNATTKKQTVTVPGVLADTSKQVIWVTQTTEAAIDAYLEAGIVPVAQAANAVTLRADTVPTADITVNIVVQEVQ